MEATGHYWKNLFATLVAAGHDVALINPLAARRFQEAGLERTKTDAIDAAGLARLAFEKRPVPSRLHDAATEALRELVRHRDRLRQDFDDRVRQLHRLVDLGFPEFTRYVRSLDSQLATSLLAEYPTAEAFARANPKRLAKLRYDGRHLVGEALAGQLVEAARRSVGQHHGPVYALQARHICQDLDLWRRRLKEIERDIEGLLEAHEVGKLITSIDGLGPHSAARIVAAVGDPARFTQRRRLRGLRRRRAGPQPVRQARGPPRRRGPPRQRRAAPRPLDAGARRRAPQPLAPRLLRAPARRRKAAQARARRRHAKAPPRRLQRRQEPQAVRHRTRAPPHCGPR